MMDNKGKTEHTPGPWVARQTYTNGEPAEIVVSAGALHICSMAQGELDQEEADARLIAAAPELLTALDALYTWVENTVVAYGTLDKIRFQVEAALAKARGSGS